MHVPPRGRYPVPCPASRTTRCCRAVRRREAIRVIHPAMSRPAYMAFGYARASGKVGAYAVVPAARSRRADHRRDGAATRLNDGHRSITGLVSPSGATAACGCSATPAANLAIRPISPCAGPRPAIAVLSIARHARLVCSPQRYGESDRDDFPGRPSGTIAARRVTAAFSATQAAGSRRRLRRRGDRRTSLAIGGGRCPAAERSAIQSPSIMPAAVVPR